MRRLWINLITTVALLIGAMCAWAEPSPSEAPASTQAAVTAIQTLGDAESLSWEQAQLIFALMASQRDIAFKYTEDGCFARTELIVQRLQQLGVRPGKAWAFAKGNAFPDQDDLPDWLEAKTPNHADGLARWWYHCAPTVPVRNAQGAVWQMVMDPSLFDRPVTVQKWQEAMKSGPKDPYVCLSELGRAPTLPNGLEARGTGYWPADNPEEGVEAHARRMMKEFKSREAISVAAH